MFLFRSAPKTPQERVKTKAGGSAVNRDQQNGEDTEEEEDYEDGEYVEEYEEEEYEDDDEEYEEYEEEYYEDEDGEEYEEYYEEEEEVIEGDEEVIDGDEEVIEDDNGTGGEAEAGDDYQSDHTPVTSNRGSISVAVDGTNAEQEFAQKDGDLRSEEMPASPKSFGDRRSILLLAAEHDRVDIIKSMLAEDQQEDILQSWLCEPPGACNGDHGTLDVVELLLNNRKSVGSDLLDADFVPPLHVAVASGSTHAASCLLRMGADPSLRPILHNGGDDMAKYHDRTAWELAFGTYNEDQDATANKKGWFGFGSSKPSPEIPNGGEPLDIPPAKLEGIRNAFTAEALRAIGGDEVGRLLQLLDSGLSLEIEVGGRTLLGWSKEMNAVKCLAELQKLHDELQQPEQEDLHPNDQSRQTPDIPADAAHANEPSTSGHNEPSDHQVASPLEVAEHRRKHDESDQVLEVKLEETNALASALSATLDSLAEEVSVTQGLLLNDGSSSWLISHVRSLKTVRAQREDEVEDWNSKIQPIELRLVDLQTTLGDYASPDDEEEEDQDVSAEKEEVTNAETQETGAVKDRLMASEQKVRKLRASIADLAEERERNIVEVERLGLTGAVRLARSLREEVRELETNIEQLKSAHHRMSARVQRLRERQQQLLRGGASGAKPTGVSANGGSHGAVPVADSPTAHILGRDLRKQTPTSPTEAVGSRGLDFGRESAEPKTDARGEKEVEYSSECQEEAVDDGEEEEKNVQEPSEAVSRGLSTDIMLRSDAHQGYLPLDLWELIRRIIGLGRDTLRRTTRNFGASGNSIMIV